MKPVSLEQQLIEYNQHRESRKVGVFYVLIYFLYVDFFLKLNFLFLDSEETAKRERENRNKESNEKISWWERAWPEKNQFSIINSEYGLLYFCCYLRKIFFFLNLGNIEREATNKRRGATSGRRGGRGRARGRPPNTSSKLKHFFHFNWLFSLL